MKNKKLIDIYYSITQLGFNGFLEVAPTNVRVIFSAKTLPKRIFNILGRIVFLPIKGVIYWFKFSQKRNYSRLVGKPCLLVISQNNKDILSVLKKKNDSFVYLAYESYSTEKEDIVPLLHWSIWLRLYKAPWVFWHFYKSYGNKAWDYVDYIFKSVGQYEACLQFLKKYKPEYIVFSNDHTTFPRALLMAAKTLEIPTIYIQHASVTPYFPPLDFDLSLLEGQATLDQYQSNGRVNGLVKFIGMPKFDSYINCRNTKIRVQNIGVCSNKMDEQVVVETFLRELSNTFPTITITFRPHPADDTSFNIPNKVLRSTKEENAFDFLKKQDLIIAGNTSIHLEAVLLNVVSIYYEFIPFEEDIRDMYRYCKNGLASHALDYEHLLELIKKEIEAKDTEVYKKAAYYNAVLGTENEGKSGALAIQYINEFMQGRS
ncbi:hypothetical protein [Aureispira sp. CCB-QB1]|uniref:hypothetical protein n=1 Tax=Aureispira sp. CCB-QB1 TaxID=1313421 RepID=UPI000696B852|nr:hypothetical protein [Aureispira sp. CCB-QB1]